MKNFHAFCLISLLMVPSAVEARGNANVRYPSRQTGIASFYSGSFHGRRMADGTRFSVYSNSAASRTLPLGTLARVTNRSNGKVALVKIRDRGPYVGHRILDVSPSVAGHLGFRDKGLADVIIEVAMMPASVRNHH